MCPASKNRSQDKRESLENNNEDLSSMFSEMQHKLEPIEEVKELLQHLKENSDRISEGMRIHAEHMKKIESVVEMQNQRIEELHKALNQK